MTASSPASKLSPIRRLRRLFGEVATLERAPIDLRILGRTLLHAIVVGLAAGVLGVVFYAGLELAQHAGLEQLTGYEPLHAGGEVRGAHGASRALRPWLLVVFPALGALAGGIVSQLATETRGGGGDASIRSFHHDGGVIRPRVAIVKMIASIFTLGSGGSGGREGPTMQIGSAIGSFVARTLKVDGRERRILLVAGMAAGLSAIFRTPLGAALFAVEVLYRDDFESDALIPALLASVVAYSVFISAFGEATLFTHAPRYPFFPAHLPLYGAMAIVLAVVGAGFLATLRTVQGLSARLPVPSWVRPALGGLAVGMIATPVIVLIGPRVGAPGQGFGILGGGYGAAQVAINGADWLPGGWRGVQLLLVFGAVKIVVTSLTVGSGGSAGDFGPSLVIGGIFGGAFGRAAQLLSNDPRIDPGAFALVGMGTMYGGLAHVPLSSLVMVCELAGSYDLLVPLMLAEGVAFVALRGRSLYEAQLPTRRESPAHRNETFSDVLEAVRVADVVVRDRPYVTFTPETPPRDVMSAVAGSNWQDVFPVLGPGGTMVGMIDAGIVRALAGEREMDHLAIAADIMQAPSGVRMSDDLHIAMDMMLALDVREIPVLDDVGQIVGFLDEADITRVFLEVAKP